MEPSGTEHHAMPQDGPKNTSSEGQHDATLHNGEHYHAKDYGNFMGHFDPGVLCTVYGLLWTYNTIKRYQTARREAVLNGRSTSKLNFKCSLFSLYSEGCCARAPVEALVLVVLTALGFCGELAYAFRDGIFVYTNTHHMCMFFFFWLTAVTHVLMHYKWSLPPRTDLAVFILANVVEALLFSGHVNGRAEMNAKAHVLLVYSVLATAWFAGVELVFPRSVLASLARAISLTVHGQWFLAVGTILYPPTSYLPKWDQNDHFQMALIATLYVTVIGIVVIQAFIFNQIITYQVKPLTLPAINRMQSSYYGKNLSSTPAGVHKQPLISDSDGEC